MLVNVHHGSASEHRRLLLLGVVFVAVLSLLVWLSVAIYQKKFERVVMVTIQAERAGLQLSGHGDVRFHGVLVGQVREVAQDGQQAVITVALRPDAARDIPRNVSVEILPTTLFGQKFVSLVDPPRPAPEALAHGDVIPVHRVRTNVELNRILAELFPLLRSVSPADLNTTLHALATALSGRGERLGTMLEDLDGYVGELNDRLPALRRNLVLLADVARTYELSAPELVEVLRNGTVTARTVVEREDQLVALLGDLTGTAEVTTAVLERNGDDLIRLGELSVPTMRLLAQYSPEYPCLLQGLDRYTGRLAEIFEGGRVSQLLELGSTQRPGYTAADRPEYGEVGHGPWCLGLPNPPVPAPPLRLRDGSSDAQHPGAGGARTVDPTSGYAGSPQEQRFLNTWLGAGGDAEYGSMGSLLYGPQVRGTEVSR